MSSTRRVRSRLSRATSLSLEDTFSCLGNFGSAGCGPLQPLEAMRRALPFLRPDATL
jgi:hypothetical protein